MALSVDELREFIKDEHGETEVRISSIYNTVEEQSYHVAVDEISAYGDGNGRYLILEPSEIEIGPSAGHDEDQSRLEQLFEVIEKLEASGMVEAIIKTYSNGKYETLEDLVDALEDEILCARAACKNGE